MHVLQLYEYTSYILLIITAFVFCSSLYTILQYKLGYKKPSGFSDIVTALLLVVSFFVLLGILIPMYLGKPYLGGFIGITILLAFFIYGPDSRNVAITLMLINLYSGGKYLFGIL